MLTSSIAISGKTAGAAGNSSSNGSNGVNIQNTVLSQKKDLLPINKNHSPENQKTLQSIRRFIDACDLNMFVALDKKCSGGAVNIDALRNDLVYIYIYLNDESLVSTDKQEQCRNLIDSVKKYDRLLASITAEDKKNYAKKYQRDAAAKLGAHLQVFDNLSVDKFSVKTEPQNVTPDVLLSNGESITQEELQNKIDGKKSEVIGSIEDLNAAIQGIRNKNFTTTVPDSWCTEFLSRTNEKSNGNWKDALSDIRGIEGLISQFNNIMDGPKGAGKCKIHAKGANLLIHENAENHMPNIINDLFELHGFFKDYKEKYAE